MNLNICVGNIVRDAEVRKDKEGNEFSSFSVAVELGESTIYPEGTAPAGVAPYLKKGVQIMVVSQGVQPYGYDKKDGSRGIGYRFIRPRVELGDAVYVVSRGNLTDDVRALDGRDFAAPTILSNVGTKEQPKTVATSFLVGEKGLASIGQYLTKGKKVTVHGPAEAHAYTTRDGDPRGEIRMGNARITLGPAPKGATAEPQEQEAPAEETVTEDLPL